VSIPFFIVLFLGKLSVFWWQVNLSSLQYFGIMLGQYTALDKGMGFSEAIEEMIRAAKAGRDSTIDMVAKIGRAARLGDRSIGFPDAGATSCFLILESMGKSFKELLILNAFSNDG
jgi:Dak2 domain-containing protein